MTGIKERLMIKLANHVTVGKGKKAMAHMEEITKCPVQTQQEFLLRLMHDNSNTEYGRAHNFANIHTVEDFRKYVPLTSYDDYAPYIERMAKKGEENLLTAYKVDHYSKSSGTMGNPKLIPFSEKAAQKSDAYVKGSSYAVAGMYHMLGSTQGLNLVESHLDTLPSGATYGSYTARLILNYKSLFEKIQTPPVAVMMPPAPMNTRYLLALYALRQPDITYCICAFFSYFVEVLRFIENNWEQLTDDIEHGRISESIDMPADIRATLSGKMTADPERARLIRSVMKNHSAGSMFVPLLWKKFNFVMGIGTAGFSTYTDILRKYCGPDVSYLFQGIIASEGVFSTLYDKDTTRSVLLPDSVFYEFKPEEQEGYDNLLTIDQVEEGKNYELVITNLSGFYRYKMRDVVKIVGKHNNTPTVEFMYRSNQTVNLMGEKTTEVALRKVAKQVAEKCHFRMVDYCMYPNPAAVPVRYEFLIEPESLPDDFDWQHARDVLDQCLAVANPSMGDKLARGIAGKSKLYFLEPQTLLLYRDMMIMKGASSAQLKPVRVIDNVVKHGFFYTLIDNRFDMPEKETLFEPRIVTSK